MISLPELATKALAWFVAPVGLLITAWLAGGSLLRALRAGMEWIGALGEAVQVDLKRRSARRGLAGLTGDAHTQARSQVVWLERDFDRACTAGRESCRSAALEFAKALVPIVALMSFGLLLEVPWQPELSPIAAFSHLRQPASAAPDSLEFLADAGLRFQTKLSELNTELAATQRERDELSARMRAMRSELDESDLSPEQRKRLLSVLEGSPTPSPSSGLATSSESHSQSSSPAPKSPAKATPSPQEQQARAILREFAAVLPACETELRTLAGRGGDAAEFAGSVQPRLAILKRSGLDPSSELIVRELLEKLTAHQRLVSRSPALSSLERILRRLDKTQRSP